MSSLLASVDLPPKKDTTTEVVRDSANYHPSIWGNHFLENASHDVKVYWSFLSVCRHLFVFFVPYIKNLSRKNVQPYDDSPKIRVANFL